MPWGYAAAAVAGALVSADGAKDSAEIGANASKKSLGFEKDKYEDWKDVYGDVQSNLGTYYNTLTPEMYAVRGVEAFNKSNAIEMEKLNNTFVQRGLNTSGTKAAVLLASSLNAAEKKATIRSTADEVVAGEKSRFLQIGLGQNPGASYSQVLAQQAQQANMQARQDSVASAEATGTAVKVVGTALSDYYNKPKQQNPSYTDAPTNNQGIV